MELAVTPSDDVHQKEIEILSEVLGNQRYGRVSGLGIGPMPSTVFSPFSKSSGTRVEMEKLQHKVKEQDDKLKEHENKLKEQDNEISTLKTQMAQLMNIVAQSQPHLATLLVSIIDSIFFLLNLVFFS